MPYLHYTRCVAKDDYDGICGPAVPLLIEGGLEGLIYGALLALVGYLVSLFVTFPLGALVGAGFVTGFLYGFGDGAKHRWLKKRLICLNAGQDECALGHITHISNSKRWEIKENPFDNDFTVNLTLIPHRDDDGFDNLVNDGLQGEYFLRQYFPDLLYRGMDANMPGRSDTAAGKWSLHCEFEGSRVATTIRITEIMAPVIGVLVIVGVAVRLAWWIALLIALVLAATVFVLTRFAEREGNPAGPGDPEFSQSLQVGDYIAVVGPAVYDSGHCVGWHEIHPVKRAVKVYGADQHAPAANVHDPAMYAAAKELIERWSRALRESLDAKTLQQQRQPEHRWLLHPALEVSPPPQGQLANKGGA
jgi:hypothetical protein